MGGVCCLGGVVMCSSASSDDEASASSGEKKQHAKRFQSVARRQSKKTVPETEKELDESIDMSASADKEPALPRKLKSGTAKAVQVGSFFSNTWTSRARRAADASETVETSTSNSRTVSCSAPSRVAVRGSRIGILAFEVANTIVKGSRLMRSLSEASMRRMKEVVLRSEGIQRLVSDDTDELLLLVASDKREELTAFSGEIARFGKRCTNPRWHNLDRNFSKLESEFTPRKRSGEAALSKMQHLMALAQRTSELYQEMHALDKFERDYRRDYLRYARGEKSALQSGITLQVLWKALENQRNEVANLRKKSLWYKNMEDVVEKLVDIVHFMYLEINSAFMKKGIVGGEESVKMSSNCREGLGSCGLALHYANVIMQINTMALVAPSVPERAKDALYQALPPRIRSVLRRKLQASQAREMRTVAQIRAEMDRTLQWLALIADSTRRLHHSNGTFGDWAVKGKTGLDADGVHRSGQDCQYLPTIDPRANSGNTETYRIETLYYADKEKTEAHILEVVLGLHHLVCKSREEVAIRMMNKSVTAGRDQIES